MSQPANSPRLLRRLFEPIDISSIVLFRIAFGIVMLWHIWKCFSLDVIRLDYIDPVFHFTWYWFDWVRPLPGPGMYLVFYTMGILAFFIAIGLHYRISCLLFSLLFTYQFLIEQAYYLNHYYLTSLISLLMAFVPAHHALSLDAWMRPHLRSQTAPRWSLWLLRLQIGIPYFYGGLAKLNPDWLRCQPMRIALLQRADRVPYFGQYFGEDWAVWFFNYGGLIFDLVVVPLLLWKRTRLLAFISVVFFHCMNSVLFDIGYFPWFMLFATTLFFEPNWPRRVLSFFWHTLCGVRLRPVSTTGEWTGWTRRRRLGVAVLGSYVVLQLVLPFRHYLYPGPVSWTEEGHRFAWHMMLRGKQSAIRYYATDPRTRKTMVIDLRPFLTERQVGKFGKYPHMVHDFALFLQKELERDGYPDMEIRCLDLVALNGRKPQLLVDPKVDLAAHKRTWRHAPWLVALHEPLPSPTWNISILEWEKHLDIARMLQGTPMESRTDSATNRRLDSQASILDEDDSDDVSSVEMAGTEHTTTNGE